MATHQALISASNPRPSGCGVDLGVDVDIQVGGTRGGVTLIEDHDGVWSAWGEPSNWMSDDLLHLDASEGILEAAQAAIQADPPTLPLYAVESADGWGVRDPKGGTWWPHEPTAEGVVLRLCKADPSAGSWSA